MNTENYFPVSVTPEIIIETVARYHGLKPDELKERTRKRVITEARHVAMSFICRIGVTETDTGEMLGGFDHSSVNTSKRKVSNLYDVDRQFREKMDAIEKELRHEAD